MESVANGDEKGELWIENGFRITDLAVSPDMTRLVAVGILYLPAPGSSSSTSLHDGSAAGAQGAATAVASRQTTENHLTIYDFETRTPVM
jgi:hypothetical protein